MLSPFAMPGAYAAGSDEIKIAVIGCGGRGTGAVFQAMASGHNVKLVAMADAFRDRVDSSYEPIAKRHPEKVDVPEEHKFVGFDGYKKAIALADVVLLTAPPGFRLIILRKLYAKGSMCFWKNLWPLMLTEFAGY